MGTRKQLIGLAGFGVAVVGWWFGLGLPLAALGGLVTTAVLLVTLTRPAGASARTAEADREQDGVAAFSSPATNMLLWGGLLFGGAHGTGGSSGGEHLDGGMSGGGFDAGGGSDSSGGFDGGGGGGGFD